MPLRNSSLGIEDLSDLSHLDELVVDKRFGQRSSAKKNRRNRHYEKQFIRNSLAHHLQFLRPTRLTTHQDERADQAAASGTDGDCEKRRNPGHGSLSAVRPAFSTVAARCPSPGAELTAVPPFMANTGELRIAGATASNSCTVRA
jgi:hypothetical protein